MRPNAHRQGHLPTALIGLLAYQWVLAIVVVTLGCNMATMGFGLNLALADRLLGWVELAVLACWGTAIVFASVGMARRRPRAFVMGMVCHLLLALLGLVCLIVFTFAGWSFDPFFLFFALMWLPFVTISVWAFFYLRRLRTRL
jgi:hypothetical protein